MDKIIMLHCTLKIKSFYNIVTGFKLETAKNAAEQIGIPNGRIDEVSYQYNYIRDVMNMKRAQSLWGANTYCDNN